MSRSSPTRQLYCAPCKNKGHFDYRHFNVEVVSATPTGAANCRCRTCGHTYVSRSRAGRRAAWRFEQAPENQRKP